MHIIKEPDQQQDVHAYVEQRANDRSACERHQCTDIEPNNRFDDERFKCSLWKQISLEWSKWVENDPPIVGGEDE